jgi:ferredoxin--NADP+ reductase
MKTGTKDQPLRVAVVGSGPAGFYTVQHLFQAPDLVVSVDMFEQLPAPFGLVRYGVAPDHPKIKSVTAVYDKLAQDERFRFYGNVEYGRDLTLAELADHYHQIVFCTGAQTDRALGIPGEELRGSHPATEFVAWYNGHPDFVDRTFDLSHRRAVVIGVGNVAVDVARILCRTEEELARTDIAGYALRALRSSAIEEVLLVGRRGPAQAAFSNPEAKELGQLEGASVATLPDEVELDPLSRERLEREPDRATTRKLELLRAYAESAGQAGKAKRLVLRFLQSPVEILGHDERVTAIRLVRNELYADDDGSIRSRPTEQRELVETGLVFRSVGYRGVPLDGLPFHERWGVIPNEAGRVLDDGAPLPGVYVSGWIKRGPSGVIGTNKPDAGETVRAMLEDLSSGRAFEPQDPRPEALSHLLEARSVRVISYEDWQAIDTAEIDRGREQGRPRVKFIQRAEFLDALLPR